MNVHILIVSYSGDLPYLELNLRTIRKFCSGFSGVTVVVPDSEMPLFFDLCHDHKAILKIYRRPRDRSAWQIAAQCQKCWADAHCPGSDFVLHTDSDCIFTDPVVPEDYFVGGKPVMLYESYSRLPSDMPWKTVTENILKRPVEYEFMRRHPQVNPTGIYSDFRLYIESLHKQPFTRFIESRNPNYPWGFSEHNAIGAFAFNHPEWSKSYHWHLVEKDGVPKEKLMQFWSHSGIDKPQEISHGGRFTPRQYTEQILK